MVKYVVSLTMRIQHFTMLVNFDQFCHLDKNSQNGRASPGLLLAPIAAQHGWVQGVTNSDKGGAMSGTRCDRVG